MIAIKKIIVLKDGFLIKAPSVENKTDTRTITYLIVFKLMRNHNIACEIGQRMKHEDEKCTLTYLIEKTKFNRPTIYNGFYYDLTKNKGRLKESNYGYTLYRIFVNPRESKRIDNKDIRNELIQSFIRGETDKKDNIFYYWIGTLGSTAIEFDSAKTVLDYGAKPPKDEESEDLRSENKLKSQSPQQPDSIISNDFRKHERFEPKTDLQKILAIKNSIPTKYQTTNTPLSIIKDFSHFKKIYNSYKKNKEKKYCVELLYYLKLLYEFLESVNYSLLENVFLYLEKDLSNKNKFRKALVELEKSGFIYINDDYILSWKILLTEVLFNEDHYNIFNDMERLVPLFSKLRKFHILLKLGVYFNSNNLFKNAIVCFREIVENIEHGKDGKLVAGAYNNWGYTLADLDKSEEAIEMYKKAIELEPEYAQPYNNWGLTLAELDRFEEALVKHEKTIELEPEHVDAYNNCGNVLVELDRFEEACIKYKKAIEIDPKYPGAYYNLGKTLARITYYKTDKNKISKLYAKAFFIFILKKKWKFANKVAVLDILNKSEQNSLYNIIFIFNMGLVFILNPNEKSSNDIKKLKDIKKWLIKNKGNSVKPYFIVIDAILENKIPEIEVEPDSNDVVLEAAITLANKIVSMSSPST